MIALAAVGLMVFTFLGTATGVAGSARASAFGVDLKINTPVSSTSLIGPLPKVAADAATPSADASLIRIGEVPAGGALIQEIGALIVNSRVDLTAGTSRASSDTAHVGLLRTSPAAGLPLPLPLPLPVPPAGAAYNRIDVDAVHGIVNLDCAQLATLRTASEVTRLNAITKGSQILGLSVPDLGINAKLFDTLTDNLGSTTDDHAAALRVRLDLATLGIPPLPAPLNVLNGNILEVTVYEVQGTNLTTPSLTNATVGVSVDMLHIRVLDRLTLGIEVDLRIGHAEATLSNCSASTPTTPPPTTGGPTIIPPVTAQVDVTKAVEAINAAAVLSQSGLSAKRGEEVEYSLTVFNKSLPSTCSITRVVDTLPEDTTFVSSAGDFGAGRFDAATNTVTWDNLAIPGSVARRQGLVLRINEQTAGGTFVNRFTADGSCGSFTAVAPGIDVAPLVVKGVQFRGPTPRTGVADTSLLVLGALMVAVAVGGTRFMRRG